jgi:SAM-dependent methyltransferase
MKASRSATSLLGRIYTQLVPGALRSILLDKMLLKLMLTKESSSGIISFHDAPQRWDDVAFISECYERVGRPISRPTDLNKKCLEYIQGTILLKKVLDAGAGLGYLSHLLSLSGRNHVTALEFKPTDELQGLGSSGLDVVSGSIESRLPFCDKEFDVAVCTHVLEHIVNLKGAISELRRVTKERLLIVVPLQSPSRYTPDLHMRYWMHPKNFIVETLPCPGQSSWQILGGDLVYEEQYD